EAGDWQVRTLLVLDATTGQNALAQARQFIEVAEVDGVLLTKMDGTAKGGMAVAVARDLRLPVLYLGVGEGAEDLVEFRPREFAAALLG
ncbi:MAG: signal recognition particle-docking protein FtsY, partial [Acidobacteria bacterium]|nr:signal recognition particle-docking protein FtsY [Acidobacteriota bacterium]